MRPSRQTSASSKGVTISRTGGPFTRGASLSGISTPVTPAHPASAKNADNRTTLLHLSFIPYSPTFRFYCGALAEHAQTHSPKCAHPCARRSLSCSEEALRLLRVDNFPTSNPSGCCLPGRQICGCRHPDSPSNAPLSQSECCCPG